MPCGFNLKGCGSNKSPEKPVNQPTKMPMATVFATLRGQEPCEKCTGAWLSAAFCNEHHKTRGNLRQNLPAKKKDCHS